MLKMEMTPHGDVEIFFSLRLHSKGETQLFMGMKKVAHTTENIYQYIPSAINSLVNQVTTDLNLQIQRGEFLYRDHENPTKLISRPLDDWYCITD